MPMIEVHFSDMCFAAYNSSLYNFFSRLDEWSSLLLLTGVGGCFSSFGGIFASLFTLISSGA